MDDTSHLEIRTHRRHADWSMPRAAVQQSYMPPEIKLRPDFQVSASALIHVSSASSQEPERIAIDTIAVLDVFHANSRHGRRHAFACYLSMAGFTTDHGPRHRDPADTLWRLYAHQKGAYESCRLDIEITDVRRFERHQLQFASPLCRSMTAESCRGWAAYIPQAHSSREGPLAL